MAALSLRVVDERVLATVAPRPQASSAAVAPTEAPQPTPERPSAPPPPPQPEPATPPAAVQLPPGAAAALAGASDVAASLRAERVALLAQLQSSEASRAVTQLTAQLAAERSARFHEELLLRSELASLQAERDTLAARVATLERERAQTAELVARRAAAPPPADAAAQPGWLWGWVGKPSGAPEAALAAVRHHLVTVTTDRDLLAADLYRSMLERATVQSERDAALQALSDASAQLSRIAAAQGVQAGEGGGAAASLGALLALSPAAALAEAAG